jgi:hypothetical protein
MDFGLRVLVTVFRYSLAYARDNALRNTEHGTRNTDNGIRVFLWDTAIEVVRFHIIAFSLFQCPYSVVTGHSPNVATIIALMVCIRFSA